MIEDVIDAGDEEPVDVGADIRERRTEMLAEPRGGFRRHERPPGNVRRGGRPLEALNLGALGFRDVARRVQIQQVGWCAVCLVAHLPPPLARPPRPLDGERLEQQIRDGLAVVGKHAGVDVGAFSTRRLFTTRVHEKRWQVPAEVVSTPLLKLREERWCPVRLTCRIVDFVRVVEERAQARQSMSGKGAIERREVAANRVAGEMVDDVALATGSGALDELAVPPGKERVKPPPAGGRGPVEYPAGSDTSGQIQDFPRIVEGHQHDEWQVAWILHLLERQGLEVLVRRYRIGKVRDLDRARIRSDHGLCRGTRPRWIARRAFVDDVNLVAERPHERRLPQPDGLAQPLAAAEDPGLVHEGSR